MANGLPSRSRLEQAAGIKPDIPQQASAAVIPLRPYPYSSGAGGALPMEKSADTNSASDQVKGSASAMPDPTREEIDAKLATVEARTETRFVELSGKIDRVADSISVLANSVSTVRTEVKHESSLTRWTMAGLVIAGIAALWLTQNNMLASFMAGIAVHDAPVHQAPSSQR